MLEELVGSPNKNAKLMPRLRLYGTDLPKNSGRASEKARNHGLHLQWKEKQEISSHCHVEKTLFSIAELIRKLWNWQFCASKYKLT